MLGALALYSTGSDAEIEAIEPVLTRLRQSSTQPVVHVAQTGGSDGSPSDEALAQLRESSQAELFVLPSGDSAERMPILRNVFARLVPA